MIRLGSKDDSFYLGAGACMRAQLLMRYKEGDLTWFNDRINNLISGKYHLAYDILLLMEETPDGNPHVKHLCEILYDHGITLDLTKVYFRPTNFKIYHLTDIYDIGSQYHHYHLTSFHKLIDATHWKYLQYVLTKFPDINVTIKHLNHNIFAYVIYKQGIVFSICARHMPPKQCNDCRTVTKQLIVNYCSIIPINDEIPETIQLLSTYHVSCFNIDGGPHLTVARFIREDIIDEFQTIYNCCKRKYIPAEGYLRIIPRDIYNMIVDYN